MHFDSASVSLAIFLITQFAVVIWWASKITVMLRELVNTMLDFKQSIREGMFPSCVRHTHQIQQMQEDVRDIKASITRVHERIDTATNGVIVNNGA